jgi:hypothetical protein
MKVLEEIKGTYPRSFGAAQPGRSFMVREHLNCSGNGLQGSCFAYCFCLFLHTRAALFTDGNPFALMGAFI